MFKVIIAGGRDFKDYQFLAQKCDALLMGQMHIGEIIVVSGKAKGADTLGEQYAKLCGHKIMPFPADWDNLDVEPCLIRTNSIGKKYNALAGHNRNKAMGEYADAAIIFWDGESTGSKSMINFMKSLNKPVRIIRY